MSVGIQITSCLATIYDFQKIPLNFINPGNNCLKIFKEMKILYEIVFIIK